MKSLAKLYFSTNLELKIKPGCILTEIVQCRYENQIEMTLKIKEAAIEGEANLAVRNFISDIFGLGTENVQIVRGQKGREKYVKIEEMEESEALSIIKSKGLI